MYAPIWGERSDTNCFKKIYRTETAYSVPSYKGPIGKTSGYITVLGRQMIQHVHAKSASLCPLRIKGLGGVLEGRSIDEPPEGAASMPMEILNSVVGATSYGYLYSPSPIYLQSRSSHKRALIGCQIPYGICYVCRLSDSLHWQHILDLL